MFFFCLISVHKASKEEVGKPVEGPGGSSPGSKEDGIYSNNPKDGYNHRKNNFLLFIGRTDRQLVQTRGYFLDEA